MNAIPQAPGSQVKVVRFSVDDHAFAVPVNIVERVVRAVEVMRLHDVPARLIGVINVHGTLVAVADPGLCFGLQPRDINEPGNRLLLVRTPCRCIALLVDRVDGVLVIERNAVAEARDAEHVSGFVMSEDGLIVIHDPAALLSGDEEASLDASLGRLQDER